MTMNFKKKQLQRVRW